MYSFYDWLINLNESGLADFTSGILANPQDFTAWLVAADYADENGLKAGGYEVGALIRSIALLMRDGMDASEEISKLSGTSDDPPGRMKLMTACIGAIPWFENWCHTRPDLRPFLLHGIVPNELPDILYSGGGINGTWSVDFDKDTQVITCGNHYETSDEAGGNQGMVDFTVSIPTSDPMRFDVNLNEDDLEQNAEFTDAGILTEFIEHDVHTALMYYLGHM